MRYEEVPRREFEEIIRRLPEARGEEFSTLLRSAALFTSPEEFASVLERAVELATTDLDGWAVAEAVSVAVQSRHCIPPNVDGVLQSLPSGPHADPSKEEALELISAAHKRRPK